MTIHLKLLTEPYMKVSFHTALIIQQYEYRFSNDQTITEKQIYGLDEEQIPKEEMYDDFYAIITNLERDISEIIRINK